MDQRFATNSQKPAQCSHWKCYLMAVAGNNASVARYMVKGCACLWQATSKAYCFHTHVQQLWPTAVFSKIGHSQNEPTYASTSGQGQNESSATPADTCCLQQENRQQSLKWMIGCLVNFTASLMFCAACESQLMMMLPAFPSGLVVACPKMYLSRFGEARSGGAHPR